MSSAILLLAGILGFPIPSPGQEPPADPAARQSARIQRALEWLSNSDPEVREMGRQELLRIGPAASAAIEKKIAERGALDLVQVLRQIDRVPGIGESWVAESELKEILADEQFRKEAEKLPADLAEKFVYLKYQEALAQVRHKHYQRAMDMVNGLLALDPKSPHLEAYRRLRRHCENMITQTSLLEAKIIQPKLWYVEGEPVELIVRIKNIFRSMITLNWDKPTPTDPGGGLLVFDVEVTMTELRGASSTDQRHQELHFEDEVPIAPGAQWERKVTLDTSTVIADTRQIRVIKVGAWSQPAKITADAVNITRRLQFEPAEIRILPKRYEQFLENPFESLEKMIAEGDPQQIYICSQLLPEADRERGTRLLIGLLAKSNVPASKAFAADILTSLTGQSLGYDPRRWELWLDTRIAENKDKKKK